MLKLIFYIFFLFSFEWLISKEFINYLGDDQISDSNPELITRGILPYMEYSNLKIDDKQNLYINLITGGITYKRLDFYLHDIGIPLIIEFTYNSGSTFKGRYGNNWQFSYNIRYIENNFNKNLILIEHDDKSILFENKEGQFIANAPEYQLEKYENTLTVKNFKSNFFKESDFIKYNFSSNVHNYVSSIEDRNLNKVIFIYNSEKQLVGIKLPSGRSAIIYYEGNLISKISIPDYGDIKYKYDELDNLINVEYPNNDKIIYRYDSHCSFLSNIICNNDTISIEYKDNKYVDKFYRNSSEIYYSLDYDFYNKINTLKDKYGKEVKIKYDSLYRVIEVYKYGRSHKIIKWNNINRISEYINPIAEIYKYQYSKDGLLTDYINPDNKKISFDYDINFNTINTIKINNSLIYYELDNKSNIVGLLRNNERIKQFNYDNFGQLIKFKFLNEEFDFLYDGLGKFKRLIINNDLEFSFDFNKYNDLEKITEIDHFKVEANYDYFNKKLLLSNSYDRINKEVYFNNYSLIDSMKRNNLIKIYYYDKSNRITKFIDNLYFVEFSYTSDSLVKIKTPIDLISYHFDYIKNIKTVNNKHKNIIYYDFLGRIKSEYLDNFLMFGYDYNAETKTTKINRAGLELIHISYDDFCRISKIVRPSGLTMHYSWDNFNRLTKMIINNKNFNFFHNDNSYKTVLPNGKSMDVFYNGRTTEITYMDYLLKKNFDRYSRLIGEAKNNIEIKKIEYIDNFVSKIIFNGKNVFQYFYNNNLLDEIIRNGVSETKIHHDQFHRIINQKNNLNDIRITYDDFNRIKTIISKNGRVSNLNYSSNNIILNLNDVEFRYEFFRNKLTNAINNNFDKIIVNYDNQNNPNKISGPEGVFLGLSFTNFNKISSITDAYNNKSFFNYNNDENLISIINKNSFSRSFSYNLEDYISEYIDFDGAKYKLIYNDFSLIARIISGFGDTLSYNYDKNLFLSSFKGFNGLSSNFIFDNFGNIIQLSDTRDTIFYEYNYDGKLIKTKFNNLYNIKYEYGNLNKLDKISLNDSIEFKIIYDDLLMTKSVRINDTPILNFNNDLLGNTIFKEIWQQNPTTFKYNENKLIIEKNEDLISKFNYDKLGRLIQNSSGDRKENYIYDLNSRLISKNDFWGNSFIYKYDKMNNVILLNKNILDSIKYTYTNNNKPSIVSLNNKDILKLEYINNRISSIKSNLIDVNFRWFNNNILQIRYPNNQFDTVIFDESFRKIKNAEIHDYYSFGLIKNIDYYNLKYDKFLRKKQDESLGFNELVYNEVSFFPKFIQFDNKNYNVIYKLPNRIQSISNYSDSLSLNVNPNGNFLTLKNRQKTLFDFFSNRFGDYTYYFDKLKPINKISSSTMKYGFESKEFLIEYFYNKNIKSLKLANINLGNFVFDDFSNLILSDDAEGNLVQYSYYNQLINEINHSNGKLIRYSYDIKGKLINSFSNSELNDSTNLEMQVNGFEHKSVRLFENNFKIFYDNGVVRFQKDNKIYNLFEFLKDSTQISFVVNTINHKWDGTNLIVDKLFDINYGKLMQLLRKDNQEFVIKDEVNFFGKLNNTLLNNDTIISNRYDELIRIKESKVDGASFLNNMEYDDYNRVSYATINNATLNYQYTDNSIKINDKQFIKNSNNSITRIIGSQDTNTLFYNFNDQLSAYFGKDKNIKLFYNSIGELSALISKDTSYFLSFDIDSINAKIIINEGRKLFDLYLKRDNDYNFPIIKISILNNEIEYLFRNSTGHPILLVDKNGTLNKIDSINILGYPSSQLVDFVYFYKDYLFIKELNYLNDKNGFYDPLHNLYLNRYSSRYLNELRTLDPLNIFDINPNKQVEITLFGIDKKELINSIDPFDNDFTDIINNNKTEFIVNEINSIFNEFKTFNLSLELKTQTNKSINEKAEINNYLPDLNRIIADLDSEIDLNPILPQELQDSILIKSLKVNKVENPKIEFEKRNMIRQIINLLVLGEVDSNFILFDKLKILENLYEMPTIVYPTNIINLEIFNPKIDDINKNINPNSLIKKISKNQSNRNTQFDILDTLFDLLKLQENENIKLLNKPYILNRDIEFNQELINKFLPINSNLLKSIPTENINRVLKLMLKPYPEFYSASQFLLRDKDNLIKIPINNPKNRINNQFIFEKSYQEIK